MKFTKVKEAVINEIKYSKKFGDISIYKYVLYLLNNDIKLADQFMLSHEYGGYELHQLNRVKKYLINTGQLH